MFLILSTAAELNECTLLWMVLEQHPSCHHMCKVTKETSEANRIMRNAIDLMSPRGLEVFTRMLFCKFSVIIIGFCVKSEVQ